MAKFSGYVSQAVWDILALKGPNLAQMAKYMSKDLESQTRPLFHTVLVTEYRFGAQIPKFAFKSLNLPHFCQNWVKIDPKWPKTYQEA